MYTHMHTYIHTHFVDKFLEVKLLSQRQCKFGKEIAKMLSKTVVQAVPCNKIPDDSYLPLVKIELC